MIRSDVGIKPIKAIETSLVFPDIVNEECHLLCVHKYVFCSGTYFTNQEFNIHCLRAFYLLC